MDALILFVILLVLAALQAFDRRAVWTERHQAHPWRLRDGIHGKRVSRR